jgi:hypothetical protein
MRVYCSVLVVAVAVDASRSAPRIARVTLVRDLLASFHVYWMTTATLFLQPSHTKQQCLLRAPIQTFFTQDGASLVTDGSHSVLGTDMGHR